MTPDRERSDRRHGRIDDVLLIDSGTALLSTVRVSLGPGGLRGLRELAAETVPVASLGEVLAVDRLEGIANRLPSMLMQAESHSGRIAALLVGIFSFDP